MGIGHRRSGELSLEGLGMEVVLPIRVMNISSLCSVNLNLIFSKVI
jgi:hypothetical protein